MSINANTEHEIHMEPILLCTSLVKKIQSITKPFVLWEFFVAFFLFVSWTKRKNKAIYAEKEQACAHLEI